MHYNQGILKNDNFI